MGSFLLKRILSSIPTFIGISLVAFFLIRMIPGDPVMLLLGERGASPEAIADMRAEMGLDRPLIEQYVLFVRHALVADFGTSAISKRPVWEEFRDRFPATVELSFLALLGAIIIGIPIGILAAVWRGRFLDRFLVGVSLFGYSMPIFWWGLLLILIFSVNLGWFPVSGRLSPAFDIEPWSGFLLIDTWVRGAGFSGCKDAIAHLVLPAVVLGTIPLGAISRMTRSSLLEVLKEDYVRTARSKGLSPYQVVIHHALKNALIPIVTIIGLMLGSLLTGAVLTETLFSWPGIGRWLVNSVVARDYPVLQGGILLISFLVISTNILVDFLYVALNPRLRGTL
jgi:dipeptide transport system permease protein